MILLSKNFLFSFGLTRSRRSLQPAREIIQLVKYDFYAPEAHFMYLTVSSSFLISFVMGGSDPNRVIKFLNAPERPEQGD
jgi:hypothetical protein